MNQQDRVVSQPQKKEHFDPGNLLLIVYLIAIASLIIIGTAFDARAAEEKLNGLPEEIPQGQLYLVEDDEFLIPSPLLKEKIEMSVSGIVNRVVVEQHFTNISEKWMEALYVFPLPEESAVDHLELLVGERKIIGIIQEKEQARETYQKAKEEGRKASLLIQQRPNIFTTRVANIAPGESIVVKIEYQQNIHYDAGVFSLRFPMVVFPRYIPGQPLVKTEEPATGVRNGSAVTFSGTGWAANTDAVPDASEITPPVDVSGEAPVAVELTVDLDAGVALSQIHSLYHGMKTEKLATGHYRLAFTGEVKADRDFVLEWQPVNSAETSAALFTEKQGEKDFSLLMLMPPHIRTKPDSPPIARELVLILDISGSMAGSSIRQAKEGVKLALQRLRPEDSFNVIVFNDQAHSFYPESVAGEAKRVADAIARVEALSAEGGTEMSHALELALDGKEEHEQLRQVVFLTDGAVGNEKELLQMIDGRLGDSRLFTVGIGAAPNSYFMTSSAKLGRGTSLFIGDINEVQERMAELFLKLENPALRDLQITGADTTLEIFPHPLPDLYYGEPLFIAFSGTKGQKLQVTGILGDTNWQAEIETDGSQQRAGIGALWARKKIRSLMETAALDDMEERMRPQIVALGLEHHLVTAYTSLVAVEQQVSRPKEETLEKGEVKTALPAGSRANMIFAGTPHSGTTSALQIVIGLVLLAAGCLLLRRKGRC